MPNSRSNQCAFCSVQVFLAFQDAERSFIRLTGLCTIQSTSLEAMGDLAKLKDLELDAYVKRWSRYVRQCPWGAGSTTASAALHRETVVWAGTLLCQQPTTTPCPASPTGRK